MTDEIPYDAYTERCAKMNDCPELVEANKVLGMEMPKLLMVVQAPTKEEYEVMTVQLAQNDRSYQRKKKGIKVKRTAIRATASKAGRRMYTAGGAPVQEEVNTCESKKETNTAKCMRNSARCGGRNNVVSCVDGMTRCFMDVMVQHQICKT